MLPRVDILDFWLCLTGPGQSPHVKSLSGTQSEHKNVFTHQEIKMEEVDEKKAKKE